MIASYLYYFSELLGFDVKYRSGLSYHGTPGELAHPTKDRHQTVEVTCRPSMKSVMVDLWYEGVYQNPSWICMDACEFY